MDGSELIKCVEHFMGDILTKAFSSLEWTEEAVTNAIHWADFCEQVFKNYKDNPSRSKLDEVIHSLSLTKRNTDQEFCFNDLRKSTELLCQAFSANPAVENSFVESILLKVKNDKTSIKVNKEDYELDSLCFELVDILKPIKLINSDRSLYSEVLATLYLKTLETAVQQMDSEDQVEEYMSDCLEALWDNTDKMVKAQLLQVLMLKITDDSSSLKDTQEFAINWTMYKILNYKNHPLTHFLWKQSSALRAISLNSSDFLNFYLDFLTECASSLSATVEGDETVWLPRYSDSPFLSFNEVLNHFRNLFAVDDQVCECAKKHLLNVLNTHTEMVIWKEIFSRVT